MLRIGRYRFFFYSNEADEPPHVHVAAGEDETKFWLRPLALEVNHGFRARDLNEIERHVREHCEELLEAWNDLFGED